MPEQKKETLVQRQKRTKPLIEDAINQSLDGDMKNNALNLVAYVRENNIKFRWGGTTNTWKARFKGRAFCFIRVDTEHTEINAWHAAVNLPHFREYENYIISEGLQDEIFENLNHCNCPHKCGEGPEINMAFGKEITRCGGFKFGLNYYSSGEPDKAMVERMKWLLDLEIKARKGLLFAT